MDFRVVAMITVSITQALNYVDWFARGIFLNVCSTLTLVFSKGVFLHALSHLQAVNHWQLLLNAH